MIDKLKQFFKMEIEFWAREIIEKRIGLRVREDDIEKLLLKHKVEQVSDYSNCKGKSSSRD